MRIISLDELRDLKETVAILYEEATDNSCGDPDCCGERYWNQGDVNRAQKQLNKFGLHLDG